jgi:hypothetical protein
MSSSTIIDSNLQCKAHFNEINNKVVEHHFKVCCDKDEGFDSLLLPKILENYNKGTVTLLKSIRKLHMKFHHIEIYKLCMINITWIQKDNFPLIYLRLNCSFGPLRLF